MFRKGFPFYRDLWARDAPAPSNLLAAMLALQSADCGGGCSLNSLLMCISFFNNDFFFKENSLGSLKGILKKKKRNKKDLPFPCTNFLFGNALVFKVLVSLVYELEDYLCRCT